MLVFMFDHYFISLAKRSREADIPQSFLFENNGSNETMKSLSDINILDHFLGISVEISFIRCFEHIYLVPFKKLFSSLFTF